MDNREKAQEDRQRERSSEAELPPLVTTHPVGLKARLRNYLIAGVLVAAPLSITLWLTWQFISFVDGLLTPFIPPEFLPRTYLPFLPFDIPGIGLILALVGLTVIGMLAAGFAGRMVMRAGEGIVDRLPIIRSVYTAVKQIFETVLATRSTAFRQAVLIEYPRRGIWAIGFITGVTEGEVQNLTASEVVNVFVPATPNPSTGFLFFVPKQDLRPLDMTMEEAFKTVISGGIVSPDDPRVLPNLGVLNEDQAAGTPAEESGEAQDEDRRGEFGLMARLRNYFLAGILVTAPLGITIWLTWNVLSFIDSRVRPFIPDRWDPETYLPFTVPGIGLVIIVGILLLIGMFTTGLFGRLFTDLYEKMLDAVPVVRGIYRGTKQIFETVLANRSEAFREVVLIEYPRKGCWSLAFITGSSKGEVREKMGGESLNVFLPTTPNPTSGFLIFFPRQDAKVLTMTVEEGAKMIISGGIIVPPDRRAEANGEQERDLPREVG